MTPNWKIAPFAAVLAPLLLVAGIAQGETKLSMADARKAALAVENGNIKSAELEKEKGKQIYSFDIEMPDGLHEVSIDAMTGTLVEDTIENAADEAKEAAQEAKDAKKAPKKAKKAPAAGANPQ